jgi:hypothetical protein
MSVQWRAKRSDELTGGVEANARLTGSTAAVLLVLLAVEGITIVEVGKLLRLHVFVGMLLVPPVLLKTATTSYRAARYYTGNPPYVDRGPPHPILRVLGPVVGVLTFVVLITGIVLLWAPRSAHDTVFFLHKASFILWFGAMTVHVLAHLADTARLAPRDWVPPRDSVPGTGLRRATLVASLVVGAALGLLALDQVDVWLRLRP